MGWPPLHDARDVLRSTEHTQCFLSLGALHCKGDLSLPSAGPFPRLRILSSPAQARFESAGARIVRPFSVKGRTRLRANVCATTPAARTGCLMGGLVRCDRSPPRLASEGTSRIRSVLRFESELRIAPRAIAGWPVGLWALALPSLRPRLRGGSALTLPSNCLLLLRRRPGVRLSRSSSAPLSS